MNALYLEPELTEPVELCDQIGNLNPEAVGWSRQPLHFCNLQGHWPRKKRWNYWAIVSSTHLFSVTLSNIDYLGLPFIYLLDFKTKTVTAQAAVLLKGGVCGVAAPPPHQPPQFTFRLSSYFNYKKQACVLAT